jgi:hypothetical protein
MSDGWIGLQVRLIVLSLWTAAVVTGAAAAGPAPVRDRPTGDGAVEVVAVSRQIFAHALRQRVAHRHAADAGANRRTIHAVSTAARWTVWADSCRG